MLFHGDFFVVVGVWRDPVCLSITQLQPNVSSLAQPTPKYP